MLADRMKTLAPSPTLAMQAKAKAMRAQGIDVISFGAGEPDFDTPDRIKAAAIRAIETGQTKYTEVGGIPELRAAVCQKFKRDNGLEYAPDEVTVSCGAKHTLYNIVMALINPGDEVLIPSPYWVSYPEQVRLLGGVPVPVPTPEATGFDLDPAELRRAVTPRTKMVVLDSPGNPTGAVFSPGRAGRGGQARGGARSLDRLGRVLRVADLRGPARVHRLALLRGEGAHHRGQHVLEGLRDDRLAHRVRGRAQADHQGDDRRAEPGHVQSDLGRPVGRGGGAERPAGRGRQDGGRVRPAPPRDHRGAERDPGRDAA